MSDKKTGTINGRLSAGLRQRLDAISRRHGTSDAVMLEDALGALADMVEREKRYLRPMRMDWDEVLAVAEEQAPYRVEPPKKEPRRKAS